MTYLGRCKILSKAAILIVLVSPFAIANTKLDELAICANNIDSVQRLICYDKLAKKTKDGQPISREVQLKDPAQVTTTELLDPPPVMEQKPQSKTVLSQTNTISKQQAIFGHENKQSATDSIDQIKVKVAKVKKNSYGKRTITLVNGQVWRQTGSTPLRLKKGQTVIIKRGAMGSFFIGKENTNKRIRAKRVK